MENESVKPKAKNYKSKPCEEPTCKKFGTVYTDIYQHYARKHPWLCKKSKTVEASGNQLNPSTSFEPIVQSEVQYVDEESSDISCLEEIVVVLDDFINRMTKFEEVVKRIREDLSTLI